MTSVAQAQGTMTTFDPWNYAERAEDKKRIIQNWIWEKLPSPKFIASTT